MFGICHVSVVLLFVRFALCQSCDCKLVDILKNIVQKEMLEREILASRVDMLESLLGSGTRNIASSSIIPSESVILERLSELETTTENIKTQLKEITTERQEDAYLNSALTKAWSVHKLEFSGLTEDIKQSSSDNNKSFHNLLTDFDKSMRLFEFKFEGLLNKSNNEATKQQQAIEVQIDTIRSDLNTTFNDYKSRMDTDIMVFINKTEKQLHVIQTEFEGLINRTNNEATTQQKQVEERFDAIRIVLNRTVGDHITRTNTDLRVFINKTEKSLYDIRAEIITDECASNPCMNGARCLDGVQRYSCICMDGYNGTNCQTEIDECASNPCLNGATCVDAIDGYSCRCQAGYMYAGTTCQIEIDECRSNPCKNGATCVDGLDSYSCSCVAGYSGLNCQMDIDDCSSNPCKNGATCVDGLRSYSCRCEAGYRGLNCQTPECNGACTYAVNRLRLCDGDGIGVCNPMRGRLEVYYNNTWGMVCCRCWIFFAHKLEFADKNANVACRILGYRYGLAGREFYRPGKVWLDGVMCVGTEQSLLDCPHDAWGNHHCDNYQNSLTVACNY